MIDLSINWTLRVGEVRKPRQGTVSTEMSVYFQVYHKMSPVLVAWKVAEVQESEF